MRNKEFIIVFIFLTCLFCTGCKTQKSSMNLAFPKVTEANFSTQTIRDEHFHKVHFKIDSQGLRPVGIVLNHLKRNFTHQDYNENTYDFTFIVNSMILRTHPAVAYPNSPNGLIYEVKGRYYLVPVAFKRNKMYD